MDQDDDAWRDGSLGWRCSGGGAETARALADLPWRSARVSGQIDSTIGTRDKRVPTLKRDDVRATRPSGPDRLDNSDRSHAEGSGLVVAELTSELAIPCEKSLTG